MKTYHHGNKIEPHGLNCLHCTTESTIPKLPRDPLSNGWHMNGKLLVEEGRYVLLDHAGHAMAEFVSEEVAASVLTILLRGLSRAASLTGEPL